MEGDTRIQLSPEGVIGRKATALRSGAERDSGAEACAAWEQNCPPRGSPSTRAEQLTPRPALSQSQAGRPALTPTRPAFPPPRRPPSSRRPPGQEPPRQPRAVTHLPAHNARRRHVSPRVPADDVAEPHVSPGLTTTSAQSKRTSGWEGGGDWRELRLVAGEGGAGEASGRMRGEDATQVAGGAELRMSLLSPFYFCLFFLKLKGW